MPERTVVFGAQPAGQQAGDVRREALHHGDWLDLDHGSMSLVATGRGFMLGLAAAFGPVDAEARLEVSLAELEQIAIWLDDAASTAGGPCSLPEVLRSLRERRNLSQASLARFLDVEPCTVSRWESGVLIPSRPAIRRIVRLLRLSRAEWWRLAHAYLDAPARSWQP